MNGASLNKRNRRRNNEHNKAQLLRSALQHRGLSPFRGSPLLRLLRRKERVLRTQLPPTKGTLSDIQHSL